MPPQPLQRTASENAITRRLVVTVLAVSLSVLLVAIGIRAWERLATMQAESQSLKANTAVRVSASCGSAVWQFDQQALDTILRSELLDPTLKSIRIFQNGSETLEWLTRDAEGKPFVATGPPDGRYDQRDFPIRYASTGSRGTTLATVSLWFDDAPVMASFWSDILWNIVIVFFIVASLTAILSWTVLRRIVRPLETIRAGMLSAGTATGLGAQPPLILGRLPKTAFPELKRMATDLDEIFSQVQDALARQRSSEAQVQRLNNNLEGLVEERTAELAKTNKDLHAALESLRRVQDELVNSAQLAVLGRLVASIAHEINTPLGAIVSSNSTIGQELVLVSGKWMPFYSKLPPSSQSVFQSLLAGSLQRAFPFDHLGERPHRKHFSKVLSEVGTADSGELADLLVELGYQGSDDELRSLAQVPEIEAIVATAAHVASISTASRIVELAAEKVTKFVSALKTYARTDADSTVEEIDVVTSIETVLLLFQHEIKLGVTVVRNFEPVALARCRPDAIQQVWANLISNALHAMEHQGTLTLSIRQVGAQVEVSVADSGKGMSPEIQSKVFSPFFTTKRPGEGTGLGLDIARRIVTDCAGSIGFSSQPGQTTFVVKLPAGEFLP